MKKVVSILLVICLTACCFAGCSGRSGVVDGPIVLKIGVSTAAGDPRNVAAQQFADEIADKSDGTVTAIIYGEGSMGGDADMIDMIALNSRKLDIVISDASNFSGYEPKMGISAMPFLFDDFDTAWAFMDSDIEADAEKGLLDSNMRVLAHYCNGFRCVTNSEGPIDTPEDMQGLVIRTPENPVIMATMSALGANPQPLSFAELYAALRQGVYDAQENPVPVIYNNKLYEVQKYLSVTNHIYSGMCFVISENTWKLLSSEQQRIVEEAALHSAESDRENNRKQTESLLSVLEKNGMIVNEPDLEPFAEATASVLETNAAAYGKLYDRLLAWKEEH